jgi:hypothetical protein
MAARSGQATLASGPPSGDAGSEAALGLCEPAPQPLSHGQGPPGIGGIQRGLGRFQVATNERDPHLRQAQPWAAPEQLSGQRRESPLNRRAVAQQVEGIEVPLGQPRRPDGIPSGQRVAHRVVGQPMRF